MEFLRTVQTFLTDHTTVYLLAQAVLLCVIGFVVIKLLMIPVKKMLAKASWDDSLKNVLTMVVRVLLYALLVLIVADHIGIPITSLLAVLSVAGLAVSLAIQDTLANVFSGMMLLTSKTFTDGDYVQIGTLEGSVTEVDLMNTYLRTADNKIVRIPNKDVQAASITNFSREPLRRVEIRVNVSYEAPTEQVKAALLETARRAAPVLEEPAPFAGLFAYRNSSIEYVLQAWTSCDSYWPAYYALTETVRDVFAEKDIAMTYDHIHVHMIPGGDRT